MSAEHDATIADLQAQVIALRMAVEGTWLSLLGTDSDPVGAAKRIGAQNSAAVGQMPAPDRTARAMAGAVAHHVDQLWGSIAWQLEQQRKG